MPVVKQKRHPIDILPTFSVIIPSHKRPIMLKRAVESVQNQTFKSFEIIIVIDGYDSNYDYTHSFFNFLTASSVSEAATTVDDIQTKNVVSKHVTAIFFKDKSIVLSNRFIVFTNLDKQ